MTVVSFVEPPQADVIEEILIGHQSGEMVGGLWQARAARGPPEVDQVDHLVLELARLLYGQLDRFTGPGRAPGADLHRHRPVPGELLIIPTRIGTGTMRTSCGVEAYSTSIHVHVALRQASIWLPASRNGRRCVCAMAGAPAFQHTHTLN